MVVVAILKAIEGKEEDMAKVLSDMIPKVQEEEGTLVYTLHRDVNDPSKFMFYEKYKDSDALMVHSTTPYFKELFKTLKSLIVGEPEISMYSEVVGIN